MILVIQVYRRIAMPMSCTVDLIGVLGVLRPTRNLLSCSRCSRPIVNLTCLLYAVKIYIRILLQTYRACPDVRRNFSLQGYTGFVARPLVALDFIVQSSPEDQDLS